MLWTCQDLWANCWRAYYGWGGGYYLPAPPQFRTQLQPSTFLLQGYSLLCPSPQRVLCGRSGHSLPGRSLSSAYPRRTLSNITLLFQTHRGCWAPATEPQIPQLLSTPRTLGALSCSDQPSQRQGLTGQTVGRSAEPCRLRGRGQVPALPRLS